MAGILYIPTIKNHAYITLCPWDNKLHEICEIQKLAGLQDSALFTHELTPKQHYITFNGLRKINEEQSRIFIVALFIPSEADWWLVGEHLSRSFKGKIVILHEDVITKFLKEKRHVTWH